MCAHSTLYHLRDTVELPFFFNLSELKDEEINEGESLVIECSQVSPAAAADLTTPSSSSEQPPSIHKELKDVSIIVGNQADLVMETSGEI